MVTINETDKEYIENYTTWNGAPVFEVEINFSTEVKSEEIRGAFYSNSDVMKYDGPYHPQGSLWHSDSFLMVADSLPVPVGARLVIHGETVSHCKIFIMLCHLWRIIGEDNGSQDNNSYLASLFVYELSRICAKLSELIPVSTAAMQFEGEITPTGTHSGIYFDQSFRKYGNWPVLETLKLHPDALVCYDCISMELLLRNPIELDPERIDEEYRKVCKMSDSNERVLWDGLIYGEIYRSEDFYWERLTQRQQLHILSHIWCPTCKSEVTVSGFTIFEDELEDHFVIRCNCVYCNSRLTHYISFSKLSFGDTVIEQEKFAVDTNDLSRSFNDVYKQYVKRWDN